MELLKLFNSPKRARNANISYSELEMCCLHQENILQNIPVFLNTKKKKKSFSHCNIRFGLSELSFKLLKPPFSSGLFFMRQTVHDLSVGYNICSKRFPHFFELSQKPGRMCELLFWCQKQRKPL